MIKIQKKISFSIILLFILLFNTRAVLADDLISVESTTSTYTYRMQELRYDWKYDHSQNILSNTKWNNGSIHQIDSTTQFKVINNAYNIRYYYDFYKYMRLDEVCFEIREKGTGWFWSDKLIYENKCYYVHESPTTKSGLEGKKIYLAPDGGHYSGQTVINGSFYDLNIARRVYLNKENAANGDLFIQYDYKSVRYYAGIATKRDYNFEYNVYYSTVKSDYSLASYHYDYVDRFEYRTDGFNVIKYTNIQYELYGDVYKWTYDWYDTNTYVTQEAPPADTETTRWILQ